MKTILRSRRDRYLAKFSIFLIIVALIAGVAGCNGTTEWTLKISSTEGGEVTEPGEATFTCRDGKVVDLVAEPEEGHRFVNWTGNVSTIANVTAASTTITMNGNYTITANFTLEILEIWDWGDLDAIRGSPGGNHRLMTTLNSTSANYTELAGPTANEGEGWEPIGTRNDPFTGSFDGQGFEIVDLSINRDKRHTGLFGYVDKDGVVQNVTVVNATVAGKDNVGGLVGNNDGTVSNSYSTGSVKGDNSVGGLVGDNGGTVEYSYSTSNVTSEQGSYIGGLVGINDEGTVSSSYSSGSVRGGENVGGLVGGNEKGTVSDSYSTGNVTGDKYVGGLVGWNNDEATVTDSYSTGNVSGKDGVGGLIGFNDKSTVSNSHYNYDDALINGENIITIGALFGEDFDEWLAKDKFLNVNRRLYQENDYYEVNNVTDFKQLLAFGQDGSLKFRLKKDLDLSKQPNFYIPYFAGKFYGNNHTISNFSFNFDFVYNVGLFGYLTTASGKVTQVGVENVNIAGASFVGGLVGVSWEGTVKNSHSTGSVTGKDYVGGLVGCNYEESTVSSSYSTSNVTGEGYVGGLVGNNCDTVENCYSSGNVKGDKYVGGLVGDNKYNVSSCNFTGNVTSKGSYIGGLAGRNGHEVRESDSTGSVTGDSRVGGLVGNNDDTVEKCYSSSNVEGNDGVGGLVGFNDGKFVKFSYSTGNVKGDEDVGGLVGENKKGTVSNSYSTGSVTGERRVGGLVGCNYKDSTVNGSYSTGRVSDGEDVGGLVGQNYDGTVTRSFWDIETSGQATSAAEGEGKAEGKNTTEMWDITTFSGEGWDIVKIEDYTDETWYIDDGKDYPRLDWQL